VRARLRPWTFTIREGEDERERTWYAATEEQARRYAEEWARARGATVERA
jgi:hypothetical protein